MAMLAMTILIHFWVLYGAIGPSTLTHAKVQPVALHCSLATWRILNQLAA